MKYIIMAGGKYSHWETPKHLLKVNGEVLIERTIRLLKENGIKDISVSTDNPAFNYLGIPILKHDNSYKYDKGKIEGYWCDAFYPTDEPTCYIFGDVFFSPEAIKTIIETETDDIEFFGSKKPFANNYFKTHEEPFALKVVNTDHLKEAIKKTKQLADENKFWRKPISWELFTVIKNAPLQTKRDEYTTDYVGINDYTCDIDNKEDIKLIEYIIGGNKMIKVEAIESFTLGRFDELKDIERFGEDTPGKINVKDKFVCTKELADYLLKDNAFKKPFVKVIEVIPEKPISIADGPSESEHIEPLDKKALEKVAKQLKKHIGNPKKTKKSTK